MASTASAAAFGVIRSPSHSWPARRTFTRYASSSIRSPKIPDAVSPSCCNASLNVRVAVVGIDVVVAAEPGRASAAGWTVRCSGAAGAELLRSRSRK